MHFVVQDFLDKCANVGIKFLQRKYRILTSAIYSKRTTVRQHTLAWVGYADNLALLFEDMKNFEMALGVLSSTFKRYYLEISISKIKTMVFNRQCINQEYPKRIVSTNNTPIENTTIFKYLRCNIKYKDHPQEIRNWRYTSMLSNVSFGENDGNY